ncbi:hypothetical protein ACFQL1_08600 [Halomicroarcula sp. GCM10025709]|uniref:DUF7289 family protein n=1 Tax=Halomicroarcula sp. GCM10025709 TaxID=3252669 RepID=UPI00360BE4BA
MAPPDIVAITRFNGPGQRGVSEVVAVVLLLVLVVLGTTVVVAFGSGPLQDSERAVGIAQAEQSLTSLDSAASSVALGAATARRLDLGLTGTGGRLGAHADRGSLRIEHVDIITGTTTEIANRSLGAVVYEDGRTEVAYQGGGVWRRDGDGSVPIARPEFHYTGTTLTLPIVQLRSTEHVHSEVTVTDGGPPLRSFPNASAGFENRLGDAKVVVTVRSRYYDAWGQYFERETDARVRYDHPDEAVTATFLALPEVITPRNGVIATSGPGKLELAGTGAYVDSYNSSRGRYAVSRSSDGTVEAAGDVNLTGNADISADVRSGGYVGVESSAASIDGNVSWTTGYTNGGTVTGSTEQINGIASIDPIDGYVYQQVATIEATNDNDETPSSPTTGSPVPGNSAPDDTTSTRSMSTARRSW